jgi:hypothetical protein
MTTTIIVSGTRAATAARHTLIVAANLGDAYARIPLRDRPAPSGMRLVHGDAGGLDRLARDIVLGWGWEAIPVPAEWEECGDDCPARAHRRVRRDGVGYCPLAGPRRNRVMVDRYGPGALGLLGFPAVGSAGRSGTWDCLHYAADQRVPILGITALEVDRG